MSTKNARFNTSSNKDFQSELRKRVDSYFKDNNISKHGNWKLYFKTFVMFSAYVVPFLLITFNVFDSKLSWFILAILMGFGMAGIGMSVMHDANHGSYSKNDRLNKILGFFSMSFLAGNAQNWKTQHNVIHHTYTNVHELDEDIAPIGVLRFEPYSEKKWIHKFQFIYAWFFYGFMTLMWSTIKDFKQVVRYNKEGHVKAAGTTLGKQLVIIILSKIVYFSYMLIPFFIIPEMTFLNWVVGYCVMHFVAGLTLAIVFQLAHVTDENEYPMPENGELEHSFMVHQLSTTMNFATNNPVISYVVGGLNFQVEHHLFPNISHIHYPKVSKIVEATAKEVNLPYHTGKSFWGALAAHTKMLYTLGRVELIPNAQSTVTEAPTEKTIVKEKLKLA